ncbi:hypothetical protein [Flagellimonas sp. CMM7]|uniref:hypothetical protein n=1 Tax=Flagellimonas sp. CMM7 TaxID=2654676 RepID=UPI0013D04F81|nr:hypothetical protein [Flagellimonas sp. CMM7]UII79574.1 hypothetical protein LV704_18175 [Flagellimonas sp. CMM7]
MRLYILFFFLLSFIGLSSQTLDDMLLLAQHQSGLSVPASNLYPYNDAADPNNETNAVNPAWGNVFSNATTLTYTSVSDGFGGFAIRGEIDGSDAARAKVDLGSIPAGTYTLTTEMRGQGTNARMRLINPTNATISSQPLTTTNLDWTPMSVTMTVSSTANITLNIDFFSSTEASGQAVEIKFISITL